MKFFSYTDKITNTDEQFNKFDETINKTTKTLSDDEFKDIFSSLDGFIPDQPAPAPEVPPLPRMVPVQAAPPPTQSTHQHQHYTNYVPTRSSGIQNVPNTTIKKRNNCFFFLYKNLIKIFKFCRIFVAFFRSILI